MAEFTQIKKTLVTLARKIHARREDPSVAAESAGPVATVDRMLESYEKRHMQKGAELQKLGKPEDALEEREIVITLRECRNMLKEAQALLRKNLEAASERIAEAARKLPS